MIYDEFSDESMTQPPTTPAPMVISEEAREAGEDCSRKLDEALDNQCNCGNINIEFGCPYCSAMERFQKSLDEQFQLAINAATEKLSKELELWKDNYKSLHKSYNELDQRRNDHLRNENEKLTNERDVWNNSFHAANKERLELKTETEKLTKENADLRGQLETAVKGSFDASAVMAKENAHLRAENTRLKASNSMKAYEALLNEKQALQSRLTETEKMVVGLYEVLHLIYARSFGGASLKYSHEKIAEICNEALSKFPQSLAQRFVKREDFETLKEYAFHGKCCPMPAAECDCGLKELLAVRGICNQRIGDEQRTVRVS